MQPVQMLSSQKQKPFSDYFSAFFESTLNFEHFKKKLILIAYVFHNYGLRKTWLNKCLKSPV